MPFYYKVAQANQYLVVTGFGISGKSQNKLSQNDAADSGKKKNLEFIICKKKFVWPLINVIAFSISPLHYNVQILAFSKEKIGLKIPACLTIGPDSDDFSQLRKYVRLLIGDAKANIQEREIRERVNGIVEGEMRGVAASMTIEEMFNDRKHFQEKVTEYLKEVLIKFGLTLYNANVRELIDSSGYFSTIGQKAQEGAISQARVAIAESKCLGDIGTNDKITFAQREVCRMKTETKVYENEREQSVVVSDANLSIQKHNVSAVVKIAGIEANKMADIEEAKLQKEVEIRNSQTQIEKLRAEQFSKTVVDAQIKKTMAEANAYNLERTANAIFNVSKCESEALAYKKSKEAESIKIMNEMNSKRITQLVDSFQESNLAFKYLAMESGIFEHLASQNVLALRGLEPKFNVWTTAGDGQNDPSKGMRDMVQNMAPLLTTVQQQTGIKPPEWMVKGVGNKN